MSEFEELFNYEEDEEVDITDENVNITVIRRPKEDERIHSSGFKDFLTNPEILKAITDCGFEDLSEIQHECILPAMLGMDVLAQAKSGMGKIAVFVLSTLQQLNPIPNEVHILVMCHTKELAFEISKEYERFGKYLLDVKVSTFCGGSPINYDHEILKNNCPRVVVGTPGRILALVKAKSLNLKQLKHFILDECDQILESLSMRRDVQEIYRSSPQDKQVMMFSATLSKDIRRVCKKLMNNPVELYVDDEVKLTLHGVIQYYFEIKENEKRSKLIDLLNSLEFNQVVIFVKSIQRCIVLSELLNKHNFPAIGIHRGMNQTDRLVLYKKFRNFESRILVTTNLFGSGMDIERASVIFNYDMPESSDTYLHRIARAGRFGTKGLAVTFVSDDADSKILKHIQSRFQANLGSFPFPDKIEDH